MKKRIILTGLLAFFITVTVSSNEVSAVWTRLYRRARTIEHKYSIMMNIVEQDNREFTPLLTEALDELFRTRGNVTSLLEARRFDELMRVIVKELGELKTRDSADLVFRLMRATEDPLLKAEALVTLGKLRAVDYLGEIVLILRNLNFNFIPGEGDRANEIIAYGAIIALEKMKEPEGFEQLFFASMGWYSPGSQVRKRAKLAMVTIVDDPSDLLIGIMSRESSFAIKLAVLEAEDRSTASDEGKLRVAKLALSEGLVHKTSDAVENRFLSRLRLFSCEMMRDYKFDDDEAVELLEEVFYKDFEINEVLTALEALGSNSGDVSATALAKILKFQNDRQSHGLTAEDYRVVKGTIHALGNTKNPIGFEELTRVEYSDWVGEVIREAKAALEMLNN